MAGLGVLLMNLIWFIVIEERYVVKMVSPDDMKFSGNWHFRSCDDAAFLSASHDASHRAQGYNSPANKHAHIKFPKPHPMHTWYAIWMLREPKWGLATFGTCFANTHFDLGLDKESCIYYFGHSSKANTLMEKWCRRCWDVRRRVMWNECYRLHFGRDGQKEDPRPRDVYLRTYVKMRGKERQKKRQT